MNIKHIVNSNFIVEAVETFFDMRVQNCPDWVGQASLSLKENLIDFVEQCGVGEYSTPSSIVDNFLINGDFVSREYNEEEWLGNADITDWEGNELEADELEEVKQTAWQNYCQDNVIIYNDDFACLSF